MNHTEHIPVLLDEVLDVLAPQSGETYLDLTAGYGGHAQQVVQKTGKGGLVVLVDRDQNATKHLGELFKNESSIEIVHDDFLSASKRLQEENKQFDMILADLGVSSPHLDNANRGFSFSKEGPLDMRMDESRGRTAADIVNEADEAELMNILRQYGEVHNAPKIARLIIEHRPYQTTTQLAQVVARVSRKWQAVHPATKVFQALRIAVNEEISLLESALPIWIDLLKPGGRLAVISFHSLEDRLVKQAFSSRGGNRYDAELRILTKKPIVGSKTEIVSNPRARSAKLRAAAKIKTKERGMQYADTGKKHLPSLQDSSESHLDSR